MAMSMQREIWYTLAHIILVDMVGDMISVLGYLSWFLLWPMAFPRVLCEVSPVVPSSYHMMLRQHMSWLALGVARIGF